MNNVSKVRETKNKLIFNKLVKENWGYTNSSYKLFRERLLFNRPIAKEYKDIIGDAPDLRRRFPIKNDQHFLKFFEKSDKGFTYFNHIFGGLSDEFRITYDQFNRNKFFRNGNEIKLFKGIKQFYFEQVDNFYDKEIKRFSILDVTANESFYKLNMLIYYFYLHVLNGSDNITSKWIEYLSKSQDNNNKLRGFNIEDNGIDNGVLYFNFFRDKNVIYKVETIEHIKELIETIITFISDFIGKFKSPSNRNIELVISLNPVDWLLCSTAEKWASCLNLQSDYMFWLGLPGLIGDKNRALAYITDGRKKSFMGMEVDHFMSRSWLLLARKKKTHEVFLNVVKEYPNFIGITDLVKENINIPLLDNSESKIVSRYYIESLNFEFKYDRNKLNKREVFFGIYLDSCSVHPAKKNKARGKPGEYLWYKFNGCGGSSTLLIDKENDSYEKNGIYINTEDYIGYDYEDESVFDYIVRNNEKFSNLFYRS